MLFAMHSGLRYLVLLFGVAALGYAVLGAATGRPYDRLMTRLASSFAGLVHLQILVGFGLLFTRTFYPALIGHLFMMFFAAAAAQIPASVMRRRVMTERTWIPHVVGTLLALVLIAGGVMAIGRPLLGSSVG
jgi:hypothetical protein